MMGQWTFLVLFIITLLAGTYAYFAPSPRTTKPVELILDKSPYSVAENFSRERKLSANITATRGFVQVHFQMKNLTRKQKYFSDILAQQQQILTDTNKLSSQILAQVQRANETDSKDLLRLRGLAMELQDDQRLLVARGQELIDLNDQITQAREGVRDQMDLIYTNLGLSRDISNDLLQHNQELIEEAREKAQDQQRINQQQALDQALKIQEQQEQESIYRQQAQDQIQRLKDQREQINR